MRHRLSVCDSGDVLLEEEHVLASGAEITDVEGPFEHELGQGYSRSIVLDGLVIVRETNSVKRDVVLQSDQDPAGVELHFALKGGISAQVQGLREALRFRPGTHVLHYAPASRLHFALAPDVRYERFEMNFTTGYFASLAERYPEMLEVIFSQVERQQPFCLHPPGHVLTPRMKSVIRQILESRAQQPLRRMLIEAKIAELLALLLQQHEEHAALPAGMLPLLKRDVDRMHEARHLVLTRMNDPPSLPELARQVGTNECKLKRDFKAVFDNTIYGLLLDHKMKHARTLLLDTDQPISEIACEVGYAHTAGFSTAFKKKYGRSPSTFRKGV